MSNMNLPDNWKNPDLLIDYLARQLVKGRLGIFLGAGVSRFYDLPDWFELIDRLSIAKGAKRPQPGADLVRAGGVLRSTHYKGDDAGFKADVKQALYRGKTLDFAKLRENDTLASIGSLVMSSRRGAVTKVISLNYDDLLENYLQFHGFTTATVSDERHWAQSEDVVIYHPHGFLPLASDEDSDNIVLGTKDYLKILESTGWRSLLGTALRTHTFLYIGLSGEDLHLQFHWNDLASQHAISQDRTYYHGVRFSTDPADELTPGLEEHRIHTHLLADYDALPTFLFRICQVARDIRMSD